MPAFDVLGLDAPFAPFDSATPGASGLLGVRLALFFVCVIALPKNAGRIAVSALGGLFVASIAAQIFVVPDLLVSVVSLFALVPRRTALAVTALAALGIVVALLPPRPPSPPEDTVAAWRARRNLWRARAVALEAAKRETPPGDAYLVLAAVDVDLGRRDRARKVVEKVLAQGTSESARAKAAALERSWGD